MILDIFGNPVAVPYANFGSENQKCREITIFDKIDSADPIRQVFRLGSESLKTSPLEFPVIDGKTIKNFARCRKAQLLQCISFYCQSIEQNPLPKFEEPVRDINLPDNPTPPGDTIHRENFVSSCLNLIENNNVSYKTP